VLFFETRTMVIHEADSTVVVAIVKEINKMF